MEGMLPPLPPRGKPQLRDWRKQRSFVSSRSWKGRRSYKRPSMLGSKQWPSGSRSWKRRNSRNSSRKGSGWPVQPHRELNVLPQLLQQLKLPLLHLGLRCRQHRPRLLLALPPLPPKLQGQVPQPLVDPPLPQLPAPRPLAHQHHSGQVYMQGRPDPNQPILYNLPRKPQLLV